MLTYCANCGAELDRPPSHIKNRKHLFCNNACRGAWMVKSLVGANSPRWTERITVTCATCGVEIQRTARRMHGYEQQFCSNACRTAWQAKMRHGANNPRWSGGLIRVPCATCGRQLKRPASEIAAGQNAFCDHTCYAAWLSEHQAGEAHPNWKGGKIYYRGPNWSKQAKAARKRDGYRCQRCGLTEAENGQALDVHHIKPFRTFNYIQGQNDNYKAANDLRNLISLCRTCHARLRDD